MNSSIQKRVRVIDSHTAGEPTRVVVDGAPDLGPGTLAERREVFRREHDEFRSAVVNEPRGSDVLVGALLTEPANPSCAAGVIFFNNVGYLNMCGHGTIGLVVTLAHLGRIAPGEHRIETPVGIVTTQLHDSGEVTFTNVPSYRRATGVKLDVEGYGPISGDVAWGGNWFFLSADHGLKVTIDNLQQLTDCTCKIRQALERDGITGDNAQQIDHVELFGPARNPEADSRNFVLCPGKAYDRSPCGTGTSAKLACLFEDGRIAERQVWRQESIVGSIFEGFVELVDGKIYPHVTGSAFVNAEATLLFDPRDPFNSGIRA